MKSSADKTVIDKAKESAKNLLVYSPTFVADCLETTIEIGHEYLQLFNDSDMWIEAVKKIILNII